MRIGVFDSGVGGITVLASLREQFPQAGFVYLGDTAHVPYGTRSPQQIRRLCEDAAHILKTKNIDVLVVACNTASSLALPEIRQVMGDVPVLGVVEPGVEAALAALRSLNKNAPQSLNYPVLVLATRATIRSKAYGNLLRAQGVDVFEQACPLLVPMIEEGWIDHPILRQTIEEYVTSFATSAHPGVALLGCTHYPWIQKQVEKALPGWIVVNSAGAVAEALIKLMPAQRFNEAGAGVEWIFTDPAAVPAFARGFVEAAK